MHLIARIGEFGEEVLGSGVHAGLGEDEHVEIEPKHERSEPLRALDRRAGDVECEEPQVTADGTALATGAVTSVATYHRIII